MERLRAIESRRGVLLAVCEERAIDLARSFADAGFVPTIAFDREQLARFGQRVELIVADDSIDPDGETLQRTGSRDDTIRVFVTEPHRHVPDDVHALVPNDVPANEVLARAQTLLALRGDRVDPRVLTWGGLQLDLPRREARWNGDPCPLTQTQFDILVALVNAGGAIISKFDLQKMIWPDDPPDAGERLVAHIRRVRSRIEVDPTHPKFLLTSRGIGFYLAQPEPLIAAAVPDWRPEA